MKKTLKELKYAWYMSRHPFRGFWEIKHEGEGSLKTAIILLVAAIIVQILSALFTGFLFGGGDVVYYNFISTIIGFLAIYFSWCIANWCLTCLNDGEGTLKDICIATAYALVPYIVLQLAAVILSNFFILREQTFYDMIINVSYVWTGILLIASVIVTHQYSLTRALVVCVFTIVGMMAIAYLGLLFFNLLQQVMGFASILIDEIILRLTY